MMTWTACLATVVLLSGCMTASVTRLDADEQRPPVPKEDVRIYLQEEDFPGSFEKVALIDLSGNSNWTDQEDMMERAREEAGEIGANGVLFKNYEDAGTGEKVAGALFGIPSDNDGEMVAIFVKNRPEDAPDAAIESGEASENSDPDDSEIPTTIRNPVVVDNGPTGPALERIRRDRVPEGGAHFLPRQKRG